jgi:hypothetical protein
MIYKIKDQHGRTLCRTKDGYGFFFRNGIAWKTRKPAEKFLQIVKNWSDDSIPKIVKI